MSNNKMLIDATHPEETRVVVLRDNRVEEFDYESAARKLLRGSIYLAKITRVEPSLQAAFVDYGGNRHGFLAFSEIHPDYYQIPHADRQAILEEELAEQQRLNAEDEDEDDAEGDTDIAASVRDVSADDEDLEAEATADNDDSDGATAEAVVGDPATDTDDADAALTDALEANAIDVTGLLPAEPTSDAFGEAATDDAPGTGNDEEPAVEDASRGEDAASMPLQAAKSADDVISADAPLSDEATAEVDETHVHITRHPADDADGEVSDRQDDDDDDADEVESLNAEADDDDEVEAAVVDEDEDEEDAAPRNKARARPRRRTRHYKIQEVVKRRQIVLIQVVKEERGNKGAALTTYLSLAGRYTVLMPNTARGGGISRKITNVQDRKRLKAIAQELDVPQGMGLIIRTAGAARTKQEIKRDFEYLLRLWENVRSLTLESTAPSLVYEEGDLIKRSIRDLYTKDIDEIIVAGGEAHNEAKGFMKMLMPSHAKNVTLHDDDQSLFARYRIEQQLNAMFSPVVQLRSGGYLVINQTEALVAVDVNSGKSTREFSIEETALNTNLEAAEELSRQLKLRDLAGLIVVDFIDMDEKRNNRAVERKLKDCLKADRARIQVGRISHFGLLEMSRQRLRTGVLEGSTMPCTHCQGSGIVRSTESVSLAVLRGLEDNFLAGKIRSCVALCSADVALYLLNQKRAFIQNLERRYGVVVHVRSSDKHQGANFAIEWLSEDVEQLVPATRDAVNIDAGFEPRRADNDDHSDDEEGGRNRSRRRRRRGGRRDDERKPQARGDVEEVELTTEAAESIDRDDDREGDDAQSAEAGERRQRRSRRRGRRGGRRHREQRGDQALADVAVPGADQPDLVDMAPASDPDAGQQEQEDRTPPVSSPAVAAGAGSLTAALKAAASGEALADEAQADRPADGSLMARLERLDDGTPAPDGDAQPAEQPSPEGVAAADEIQPEATEPAATADEAAPTVEAAPSEPPVEIEPQATARHEAAAAPDEAAEEAASQQSEPVAATASAETEQEDNDRAARSQPVASEPVVQRVVVGPNGSTPSEETKTDELETTEAPPAPARRGWWQRPFSG
jgi:ribonuclease E